MFQVVSSMVIDLFRFPWLERPSYPRLTCWLPESDHAQRQAGSSLAAKKTAHCSPGAGASMDRKSRYQSPDTSAELCKSPIHFTAEENAAGVEAHDSP